MGRRGIYCRSSEVFKLTYRRSIYKRIIISSSFVQLPNTTIFSHISSPTFCTPQSINMETSIACLLGPLLGATSALLSALKGLARLSVLVLPSSINATPTVLAEHLSGVILLKQKVPSVLETTAQRSQPTMLPQSNASLRKSVARRVNHLAPFS